MTYYILFRHKKNINYNVYFYKLLNHDYSPKKAYFETVDTADRKYIFAKLHFARNILSNIEKWRKNDIYHKKNWAILIKSEI